MNKEVQNMFMILPENKLQLALFLRDIILGTSVNITETIKWGRVTFCYNAIPIAFLCMHKEKSGIELGFFHNISFGNMEGNLELNKKNPRRIRFLKAENISDEKIQQWIIQAGNYSTMHR